MEEINWMSNIEHKGFLEPPLHPSIDHTLPYHKPEILVLFSLSLPRDLQLYPIATLLPSFLKPPFVDDRSVLLLLLGAIIPIISALITAALAAAAITASSVVSVGSHPLTAPPAIDSEPPPSVLPSLTPLRSTVPLGDGGVPAFPAEQHPFQETTMRNGDFTSIQAVPSIDEAEIGMSSPSDMPRPPQESMQTMVDLFDKPASTEDEEDMTAEGADVVNEEFDNSLLNPTPDEEFAYPYFIEELKLVIRKAVWSALINADLAPPLTRLVRDSLAQELRNAPALQQEFTSSMISTEVAKEVRSMLTDLTPIQVHSGTIVEDLHASLIEELHNDERRVVDMVVNSSFYDEKMQDTTQRVLSALDEKLKMLSVALEELGRDINTHLQKIGTSVEDLRQVTDKVRHGIQEHVGKSQEKNATAISLNAELIGQELAIFKLEMETHHRLLKDLQEMTSPIASHSFMLPKQLAGVIREDMRQLRAEISAGVEAASLKVLKPHTNGTELCSEMPYDPGSIILDKNSPRIFLNKLDESKMMSSFKAQMCEEQRNMMVAIAQGTIHKPSRTAATKTNRTAKGKEKQPALALTLADDPDVEMFPLQDGDADDEDKDMDADDNREEARNPFNAALLAYLKKKNIGNGMDLSRQNSAHPFLVAAHEAGGNGPSINNLLLDWHQYALSPWNKDAVFLLAREGLAKLRKGKQPAVVADPRAPRASTTLVNQATVVLRAAEEQALVAQCARRISRKHGLYEQRGTTILEQIQTSNDPETAAEWNKAGVIHGVLAVDGMSSDETDVDSLAPGKQKTVMWVEKGYLAEDVPCMWTVIDSYHNPIRPNGYPKPGNKPLPHKRQVIKVSKDRFKKGLPQNLYCTAYWSNLNPMQRLILEPKLVIPIPKLPEVPEQPAVQIQLWMTAYMQQIFGLNAKGLNLCTQQSQHLNFHPMANYVRPSQPDTAL
ncbi:hypothetical protein JAAARDRAFT_195733 [Jaapia argillacea MUCL 33604]|uniref:Uncharacterized protein n=1 Tax=Jaapia argillacea MUCL 33604 TaxID=933084 RepID=A0A067PNF6_9AGAM|nr:hypothetical protein JAAARDRAFT_195733 [Jaapia argillacea MUCL 33604]